MALIAAKCTQCGANINVDDSKDAEICLCCGTAFVTEKVINNHTTVLTKNITKNIYGKEKTEAEEYLLNGEQFIVLKDWEKATNAFTKAAEANPFDYKSWLGLIKSETQNFTDLSNDSCRVHLEKAIAVANDTEKDVINTACLKFFKQKDEYDNRFKEIQSKLQKTLNRGLPLLIYSLVFGFCGFTMLIVGFSLLSLYLTISLVFIFLGTPLVIITVILIVFTQKTQKQINSLYSEARELNNKILNTNNQ